MNPEYSIADKISVALKIIVGTLLMIALTRHNFGDARVEVFVVPKGTPVQAGAPQGPQLATLQYTRPF